MAQKKTPQKRTPAKKKTPHKNFENFEDKKKPRIYWPKNKPPKKLEKNASATNIPPCPRLVPTNCISVFLASSIPFANVFLGGQVKIRPSNRGSKRKTSLIDRR